MFVMQRLFRLAAALLVSGIVNTLRSSSRPGVSWVRVWKEKSGRSRLGQDVRYDVGKEMAQGK